MPVMLMRDRIAIIRAHLASIERAERLHNYSDIAEFFKAISSVAAEGAEINTAMVEGSKPLGG